MVAQSWLLCRRLLLVDQRRGSTPPRKSCSRTGDVAGFCTWVGSLIRVLGGGQPPQRDVPGVPADLWQATVRGFRILQGETRVSVVPRLMLEGQVRVSSTWSSWTGLWTLSSRVFHRPTSGVAHFPRLRGADLGASQRRPLSPTRPIWSLRISHSSIRPEVLPGPPSFEYWRASFRVYRTTIQLLGTAPAEHTSLSQRLSRFDCFIARVEVPWSASTKELPSNPLSLCRSRRAAAEWPSPFWRGPRPCRPL